MGSSDFSEMVCLLPGLVAAFMLTQTRTLGRIVLWVYLPCLLFLPLYYGYRLPHLPDITFTTSVSLVIGLVLLPRITKMRLRVIDVAMLLFMVSAGISEAHSTLVANGGLVLFSALLDLGVPYLIGRLIIEQEGIRSQFVHMYVVCMALMVVLCLPEYIITKNVFQTVGRVVFPAQPSEWGMQMRWGHARLAGPYAHAILAGMMFLTAMLFIWWIMINQKMWFTRPLLSVTRQIKGRHLIVAAFFAALFMTQSRGPWIGCLFGLGLAVVGVAKRFRRALFIFFLVAGVLGPIGYSAINSYTASSASGEEQQSIKYRQDLIPSYMPIIEKGGMFGWGIVHYPIRNGQGSIDNEYLLLAVTQGYLGFYLFVLMIAEAFLVLCLSLKRMKSKVDRTFVFTLMGILAGICLSITTVFIGYQVKQMFFLMLGWAVSLEPVGGEAMVLISGRDRKQYAFEKVYT